MSVHGYIIQSSPDITTAQFHWLRTWKSSKNTEGFLWIQHVLTSLVQLKQLNTPWFQVIRLCFHGPTFLCHNVDKSDREVRWGEVSWGESGQKHSLPLSESKRIKLCWDTRKLTSLLISSRDLWALCPSCWAEKKKHNHKNKKNICIAVSLKLGTE